MTAGITLAAPLVGEVTTLPPAAFSSLTAIAKSLPSLSFHKPLFMFHELNMIEFWSAPQM